MKTILSYWIDCRQGISSEVLIDSRFTDAYAIIREMQSSP